VIRIREVCYSFLEQTFMFASCIPFVLGSWLERSIFDFVSCKRGRDIQYNQGSDPSGLRTLIFVPVL